MNDMAPPFRRRPLAPFALTLGLHLALLVAAAWTTGDSRERQREAHDSASTFVLVRATPESPPTPAAIRAPPPPSSRARAPSPVRAQAPQAEPAPPATVASDPMQTATPAATAAGTPAPALPGDLLAISKRMAGGIDRELRKGGSPITAEPERKWERFAAAFAAARTSVSRDTILESYTAADGVTFYRKTVGGKVACYRSGSVGGLGPADGRSAGSVPDCPSGAVWTRQ